MINKRLLIKNIISHNDENTFFDKKSKIDINSSPGKAKLLKHINALSNSNPYNESYIIFGITDDTNELLGVDFVDDSKIQNLVKSFLINAPIINYENISFTELDNGKSIGILTIAPTIDNTKFSKNIWKINKGDSYYRYGSNSILIDENFYIDKRNQEVIKSIHNNSKNNLKNILDGVEEFKATWSKSYNPAHLVYKDQFVLCWSGYANDYGNQEYFSEVDVQIINENKRLFFSAVQFLDITYDDSHFIIKELTPLGFDNNYQLYPLEKTVITFQDNGTYTITNENIFTPPLFPKEAIDNLYQKTKKCEKSWRSRNLKSEDSIFAEGIANYYLICYLNGIKKAKEDLINSREYLDGAGSEWQSVCLRILYEYEKVLDNY